MRGEHTVVVRTKILPEEEEEEIHVFAAKPAAAPQPAPKIPDNDDDDDDEDCIAYVAHTSAPVNVATARSVSLKRPRSSTEESAAAALDAEAGEFLPDDTDNPHDRTAYERWKARDAVRPKKLLLG
ncbi:hypothetical protein DQ04_09101000 [Trypanosoma grayi]|uniref:hypothetical protein n=1 Tax=Trypanosoma grayi TaxID=71804 RepID=UPI0004F3F186|nr:hypothetical protein DQ04_09101000 [Trypanosoma grayi]KEG07681.1 hypothetical protein DQ04_09101000 [Trypanosoma grayi]